MKQDLSPVDNLPGNLRREGIAALPKIDSHQDFPSGEKSSPCVRHLFIQQRVAKSCPCARHSAGHCGFHSERDPRGPWTWRGDSAMMPVRSGPALCLQPLPSGNQCSSRRNSTVWRDRWGLFLEAWGWGFGLGDVSSGKHFKSKGNRVQLPFKELFMIPSDLGS